MLTAIAVIIIFCVLVISHEFGHFLAAKSCGIYVTDFSIGMGPKLFAFKGKETQYTVRLLPVGGWCKMIGEDEASDDPRAFNMQPIWQRMLVVFAGPLMNFLIAILIFIVIFMMMGTYSADNVVGALIEDTPAAIGGMQEGDEIIAINGTEITSWADISPEINAAASTDSIVISVNRDGNIVDLNIEPYYDSNGDSYKIGIQPQVIRQNIFTAISLGFRQSVEFTRLLLVSLFQMITGQMAVDVAGPVGIVKIVDEATTYGIKSVLLLTGYLCINLGVINLLPFPALDGFRLLFLAFEGIRRKPFNREHEGMINFIGLMVLLALMAVITFNDIVKLIE